MVISDLFSGIAVVIDDEIGKNKASINNLIKQIKDKNMPCLEYKELPDISIINHLRGISFLLLDWKLIDIAENTQAGVKAGEHLLNESIKENITFLKKLLDEYFLPVFIFTAQPKDGVIAVLRDNGLYSDDKPSCIFVKDKKELTGKTRLFKTIDNWVRKTPPIYVAKEWEKEYSQAKNRMFHDFYKLGSDWPKILWKTFSEDGANESLELGETITRNLHTRMTPFNFNNNILNKRRKKSSKDELRKVLEGARFIKSDQLHDNDISTGDVFKEEYDENGVAKYRYFLNIRAQCDLVRSHNPQLYCLKGRLLDESKINKKNGVPFIEGQFIEKVKHAIVGYIDEGKIVEFSFVDLKQIKWNGIKAKRIGRLLPPYITNIQQRFALYLKRQGLPRTPREAI